MEKFLDQFIVVAVLAGALSALLIPLLIRIAHKYEILSQVDFRRKTGRQVPLLGGVAIYLVVTSLTLIYGIESFYKILLCFLPLLILGVIDDKKQLQARSKAFIQLAAILAWAWWTPAKSLLLVNVGLDPIYAYPLTVFWIVGLINALNMIDGMDMEAGGFSIIAFATFAIVSADLNLSFACITMVGALCGFLVYNKPPARIYLGESGSTFLGFTLGAVGSTLPLEAYHLSSVLVPLFILAFPEIDAVLSMYRRWKISNSLFRGDHDHIHHKIKKLGLSVNHALVIIFCVSIYCSLTAYINVQLAGQDVIFGVNLLTISGLLAMLSAIYFLEYRQTHQVSTYSKTILNKYLNLKTEPQINTANFHAVIYDLFPYYQELQMRGFSDVNKFVRSFAEYIKQNHPNTELYLLGSYTIVTVGPFSNKLSTTKDFFSLTTKFYELLDKFQVTKGDGIIPNGMAVYSSQLKPREFVRKYDIKTKGKVKTKLAS